MTTTAGALVQMYIMDIIDCRQHHEPTGMATSYEFFIFRFWAERMVLQYLFIFLYPVYKFSTRSASISTIF